VSTELHKFEDILLDDNDDDTENLYEPQCDLTPLDFLDFQHSDIYLDDNSDSSMINLNEKMRPLPEPPLNYVDKIPLTFHTMASAYQKLKQFLRLSFIHVPHVVNENVMKDYISKANKMLSKLLLNKNNYEYDDLIFPELRPNPCIYPFTKT